ncbi:uncharacterized protein LOC124943940 [Impatiens glandulifera]|uniref:uncharacterized protein LOC124943940 n=1 Tax=Impatiens glandulifera TaxID=253017 RepID=UPI001FB1042D|nr:uncharacterized protein LOC124943940 [Impatiens glandulifera]
MGRLNLKQDEHEQTTITHFSHIHPLHLTNINNQFQTLNPSNSPCSACKLPISGSVYSCHYCKFFLHLKCTQMPQHIKHPFDRNNNHVFSLLPVPLYPGGYFKCDACCKQGNGFSYHCGICTIDLHLLCASMPLSSSHHSHPHELRLSFFPPYKNKGFSCDVCKNPGLNSWLYRCDHCEFDVHLNCATSRNENRLGPTIVHIPNITPIPPPSQSPNVMTMITHGLMKGVSEEAGQQLFSLLSGGLLQGSGGSGGEMLQGGGGGSLDLSSVLGGGGGSAGMDQSSVLGGGGMDLSSVLSGGGMDLSSVLSGGGGGGMDLSSVLGGMDPSSLLGGGMDITGGLGGL